MATKHLRTTQAEKMRRFRLLEELQEGIVEEINSHYMGEDENVLFEKKVKGRWKGRTETNKLVFVESEKDLQAQVLPVQITWAGPWSMQGRLYPDPSDLAIPLVDIPLIAG